MLNFFAEIGLSNTEKGLAIIDLMVKTEKIDRDLWENHKVIACPAFLDSIKDAYDRRSNPIITLEEIRAKFQNTASKVIVSENTENAVTDGVIVSETATEIPQGGFFGDKNPQTKLKETKLNESKEESSASFSQSQKDAFELSELLLTTHRKEIPDYLSGKDDEKTIGMWAADIEKLIRIDKKQPETIRRVVLWAKTPGCFWFPNIQSGKKLREKYETLYGQMTRQNKTASSGKPPERRTIPKGLEI